MGISLWSGIGLRTARFPLGSAQVATCIIQHYELLIDRDDITLELRGNLVFGGSLIDRFPCFHLIPILWRIVGPHPGVFVSTTTTPDSVVNTSWRRFAASYAFRVVNTV